MLVCLSQPAREARGVWCRIDAGIAYYGMKIYLVGGAVRDELLKWPVQDRDWVVVGATPAEMLAAGYRSVGKDFPVYLHPQTNDEYALARTERKTLPGYSGFVFHTAPTVTLEEDLSRRDLTINAMAMASDGTLIDPYAGRRDLDARIFRHVGPAFAEDPVRILRIARFAARFEDFSVAPETMLMMRAMVLAGEVNALVPERVWQEIARGLMESKPSRMFAVLRECGALARLIPELDRLWDVSQHVDYPPELDTRVHAMMALDVAAKAGHTLPVRYAALLHDLGKGTTQQDELSRPIEHEASSIKQVEAVCTRLKVPAECRDLALLLARHHSEIHHPERMRIAAIVGLLEKCDALRRPERFAQLLAACAANFNGRLGWQEKPYQQADFLAQALVAAQTVPAGEIAKACTDPAEIPKNIRAARVSAVRAVVRAWLDILRSNKSANGEKNK